MAASAFNLDDFVKAPTLEQIELCKRGDLDLIAGHYGVQVSKQTVKKQLRALVVGRLVELGLIADVPVPAAAEQVTGTQSGTEGPGAAVDLDGEGEGKPPGVETKKPPSITGLSSAESQTEARTKVRLARLRIEADERRDSREIEYRLQVKKLEIEAETSFRMRELELRNSAQYPESRPTHFVPTPAFDISKHIALVPQFREAEVDTYFTAFERIAGALKWPADVWPLLLQCKIHGKAQEVVSALPLEDSLDYNTVKAHILRAYELVPEAYRQKFRGHRKTPAQTYVEFARDKGSLFDKWCAACEARDFPSLRELILLEDFKKHLPERMLVYLNEQKV